MRGKPVAIALVMLVGCGESGSTSDVMTSASPTTSIPVTSSVATTATTTTTAPTTSTATRATILFDFATESADGWYVQNDTVMGGVSSSGVEIDDGDMVFAGNLSTDNNGGFASVRSPVMTLDPERSGTALTIDATGDGRTYLVQLRTSTDSYIVRYVPADGPMTLPFTDFTAASWRLDPIAAVAPLTAGDIGQIAIYLLDKQVGEFALRVRSIAIVAA